MIRVIELTLTRPSASTLEGEGDGGAAGARRQREAAEGLAAVPRQERRPPGGTAMRFYS